MADPHSHVFGPPVLQDSGWVHRHCIAPRADGGKCFTTQASEPLPEHRHFFTDPVVTESGGINYRCTTPINGGRCPEVEFHPPNTDPLIQAIIIALHPPLHDGMYINRFGDSYYDIEGTVDLTVVAVELRSRFRITPIVMEYCRTCRRDVDVSADQPSHLHGADRG